MARESDEVFDEDLSSFEKEMESPEKLLADEILPSRKARPPPKQGQGFAPSQRIPAFVSLTRYKELRLALHDMKALSANMRRILEDLKANRDSGTTLLDETVESLESIEKNIDKIKGVLRV